ncbi:MAG TPA: hypothetical protein VFD84_18200 [Candidatus Binatia bacterium]|jgi:hypothetical protein|nr:hypothetical protein [Candidatus Binatia bacterium]
MRLDGYDPELAPELVLPSQFFARSGGARRPEQRLMLAVLDRAVWELQKHAAASGPRARRRHAELAAWFASDDDAWPFAFVNLCRALDLDPDWIRRGVAALRRRADAQGGVPGRIRRIATGPRTMSVRAIGLRRTG